MVYRSCILDAKWTTHKIDTISILIYLQLQNSRPDPFNPSIKESAMERYSDFYAAVNSHHNGSLNTFYVKLDLQAFKE
jgi:hypothetical protein